MKKGNWLWFLVCADHAVPVKAVCGYDRRHALEEVREICGTDWPKMQREGARLERIFVQPNAQGERQP